MERTFLSFFLYFKGREGHCMQRKYLTSTGYTVKFLCRLQPYCFVRAVGGVVFSLYSTSTTSVLHL